MMHLKLYASAGSGADLNDYFGALYNVAYSKPAHTYFRSAGGISLDPANPYPQALVVASYRGTDFDYSKYTFSFPIGGGQVSRTTTWNFESGRVSSVALELDHKPLLQATFDTPYLFRGLGLPDARRFDSGVEIIGNGHANALDGSKVGDILSGLAGDDVLQGREGADLLLGGPGRDTLAGGAGADLMEGGRGNDTYRIDTVRDRVVERSGEGTDGVYSSVSYTLSRQVENLTLTGDAYRATGNALANVLRGNGADNRLEGAGGDDTLIGGPGQDRLSGGTGADAFVFERPAQSRPDAPDVIADFKPGTDTIDLGALGLRHPAFIGDDPFSHTRGEVRFDHHVVSVDVSGDGIADLAIRLKGDAAPTARRLPVLTSDDLPNRKTLQRDSPASQTAPPLRTPP